MADDKVPVGFFSRWSRRKIQVREGFVSEEPAQLKVMAASAAGTAISSTSAQAHTDTLSPAAEITDSQKVISAKPMPSMADAQQLTPESDFTGFMIRGVSPEVKNAAMKKLFSDPHFNVMDRMDIYIDDYTQPDPLPITILRQMSSSKTLNLFDEDAKPSEPLADQTSSPFVSSTQSKPSSALDETSANSEGSSQ